MIYKNTITDKMYEVATKLKVITDSTFYLAGGTALSLQIGHRESVDLDYFTEEDINTEKLFDKIVEKFNDSKVLKTYEEKNTLWLNIDGVKLSFIARKNKLIKNKVLSDIFVMASIEDILIMKLSAICSRSEYKDYYDLACISKINDSRNWINLWSEANQNSDPLSWMIALNDFENVEYLDLKGESIINKTELKSVLKNTLYDINKFARLF
jgi:predicted nucleotidyltransferase component of viral defense system